MHEILPTLFMINVIVEFVKKFVLYIFIILELIKTMAISIKIVY